MNQDPAGRVCLDRPEAYLGQVLFVSGPEKHCGKTTFMNRAMQLARRGTAAAGRLPPAVMTVGYDGEARDFLTGVRKPAVPICSGEVFVTAERFLRSSGTCSEILDVAPGVGALGRLCVARANRDGVVALVGPEGNKAVAWILETMVGGGLADTVLVDGAINRITQAASRAAARFVYVLRVDRAGLRRAVDRVRRMAALMALPEARPDLPSALPQEHSTADWQSPVLGSSGSVHNGTAEALHIDGVLTSETAARIPEEVKSVVVEDFTKIFLDRSELAAFTRTRSLAVARRIDFAGFVVSCRGLADEEFIATLDDPLLAAQLCFNPYRAASGGGGHD